jgi:hypothetical protein
MISCETKTFSLFAEIIRKDEKADCKRRRNYGTVLGTGAVVCERAAGIL